MTPAPAPFPMAIESGSGVAIVEATRELEPQEARPIGWDGKRVDEMLAENRPGSGVFLQEKALEAAGVSE